MTKRGIKIACAVTAALAFIACCVIMGVGIGVYVYVWPPVGWWVAIALTGAWSAVGSVAAMVLDD